MNVSGFIKGDKVIWVIVVLLSLLSLLAVYSSIVALAYKHQNGDTAAYLFKHGRLILLGLFLMFMTHRMKYVYFSRISQIMVIISVPLLLYTLLRGSNINEANRWIAIAGLTFQTSDFAKLALIMYVARVVTQRQSELDNFKLVLLHIMLPAFIVCGLILPANFSTAALLLFTCLIIMFIGRVPLKHIFKVIGIAIAGFALLLLLGHFFPKLLPRVHLWEIRIEQFFAGEGEQDPDKSYQSNHAKIAIATGGLAGKGAGNSSERNFLPQAYSDFIYAIIIEEYGSIIGGCIVVLLYIILLYRAVRVATRCERTYGTLLAFGISFSLIFQALINMAVAVNLLPVTGQPLPFLSMGGTSLLFSSIAVGVILSISRETEAKEESDAQLEKGGSIATA
ncbi:MAG TPA: FtsW/RodA/SpoVE family cell cycle protein [Bacteroidia bacterium]|jgi:cell division protein FtsW|nr:FtsW/RodA/SpoVE family cell cycle protein [Bacteroidia bacterium]